MPRFLVTDGDIAFVWSTIVDAPVTGYAKLDVMKKHYPQYPVKNIKPFLAFNRAGKLESRVKTVNSLKKIYEEETFD